LGKDKSRNTLDQFNNFRNATYDAQQYKNPFEKFVVDTAVNTFSKIAGLDAIQPVKGETRIANNFDPAAMLDGSAERYDHPDPFKYISGGGPHDYHEGIARFTSGFDNTSTTRPGNTDTNYRSVD
jgi:hypothetical protein